jgi:hypothetical protein
MATVQNLSNVEFRVQYTLLQRLASFEVESSNVNVKPAANTSILMWEARSWDKDVDLLTIAVREEPQASASPQFQIVGNSAILEGNVTSNTSGAHYSSEEPILRAELKDLRLYATLEQSGQCTRPATCETSPVAAPQTVLTQTLIVFSVLFGGLVNLLVGTCCFVAARGSRNEGESKRTGTLAGPGGGGGYGGGGGGYCGGGGGGDCGGGAAETCFKL